MEKNATKRIVMTGGGTAGHVTPNIALLPALQKAGYDITYIGSYNGMEKELIEAQKIPYIGISSGKLRRYFDLKNFSDPFKVLKGYTQAVSLMKKLKPNVVFSKEALSRFLSYWLQNAAMFLRSSTNPTLHQVLQTASPSRVPGGFAAISRRQCSTFPLKRLFSPAPRSARSSFPETQRLPAGSAAFLTAANRFCSLWGKRRLKSSKRSHTQSSSRAS